MVTPALLGYADRFSVAPGETIRFMVSAQAPRYRASLVRLFQGDESPNGPGYREVSVASSFDGEHSGRPQQPPSGSYVRVPSSPLLDLADGFTVQAWIWPTTPRKTQSLISRWSDDEQRGFDFGLDESGHLTLRLGAGDADAVGVRHDKPLVALRWAFVAASFDASSGTVRLAQGSNEPFSAGEMDVHEENVPAGRFAPSQSDLLLANGYNGKLDRPRLYGRAFTPDELDNPPRAALVAAWDFSADIRGSSVPDTSPHQLDGRAVNSPTRGVTDHTWDGTEQNWTRARQHYAAIQFHDDDLEDAGWQADFEWTVPSTTPSGVYAARLDCHEGEDYVPFYVRPPRGTASARAAFLAPTLTYMAYANERLYWNAGYQEKRPRLTPLRNEPPDIDQWLSQHRELGLSMYDVHSDGSGVSYSSRLRPILNMRPKYRAWRLHEAPRHFAGDLYVIGWLDALGIECDVITDEDLHFEGVALLSRYQVVMTGGHPEYITRPMHTAVRQYLDQGGRLMYLGGNGFYWVTSIDPSRPHLIELRRGISGTRTWESQPGEWYHSTTGELGGLWRTQGYGPQRLVGVGFAAQGWGGAAGYSRLSASFDPRAAFVFDGIGSEEVIGDFGLALGGAAGDEVDRFDLQLGSPAHALVLATSAGRHSDYYQVTVEDITVMVPGQGGTESPLVRADMVFFETPNGGAVFSVGSINWLASLAWNRYLNNVARVTQNVLRRFLDPEPFVLPEA
jgi:N,N-dimethylformamidase